VLSNRGTMEIWNELGRLQEFQQGEILWSQEEAPGIGAFLVSGVLGIEKVSAQGDRVVFTALQPGALLGEMSCLDGEPHSATVKVLTRSTARIFTRKEFNSHLDHHPHLLRALLQKQNERLRFLTDKLLRVGTEPVQRRLVYWICEQSSPRLEITHHELAALLATTRESVSKALGELRKKKLLKTGRGFIEVVAPVGLARLLEL